MKKRENSLEKKVLIMLLIVILAIIALSGTYAKYTTSTTGTGKAAIADWDIKFSDGTNNITTTSFDIDLANTMTSKDSTNAFIQPGSKGSFTITVTNDSDVPATVSASVTDSSSTIFNQKQFTLTTGGTDAATVAAGESKEITVSWEWTYNKSTDADTDDTTIGTSDKADGTTKNTICTIQLTATQVDPNA